MKVEKRFSLLTLAVLVACSGGGGGNSSSSSAQTPVVSPADPAPVIPVTKVASWTTISTQPIPYSGTYFARGVLNNKDGSVSLVFSGPAAQFGLAGYFTCVPVPFKALRFTANGAFTDDTARINPQGLAAVHAARIAVADFNGDGVDDIYAGSNGCDNNTFPEYALGEKSALILSSGSGYIDASTTLPPLKNFVHSIAAGDIRKTGNVDILVGVLGMQQNPGVSVEYLSGTNTTGSYVGPYILRSNKASKLTYDATSLPQEIALNNGQPTVTPGRFVASRFADLNGDGYPDLIVGSEQNSTMTGAVFLNDGKGAFLPNPIQLPVGIFGANNTLTMDILAKDMNGDGKPDLILNQTTMVPYYGSGKMQVIINQGGSFTDATETYFPSQSTNKGWAQYIHLVDLNGDGQSDLLLDMDTPADTDIIAYRFDGNVFSPMPRSELPSSVISLTPVTIGGVTQLVSVAPDIRTGKATVTTFQRK